MRRNAKAYIDSNYRWEVIMRNFSEMINHICEE